MHEGGVVVVLAVVVCQCCCSGGVISSCQAQVVFFWHSGVGTTGGARRGHEGVGGQEGHRAWRRCCWLLSWRRQQWHCCARPRVLSWRHCCRHHGSGSGIVIGLGVVLQMPLWHHSRAIVVVVVTVVAGTAVLSWWWWWCGIVVPGPGCHRGGIVICGVADAIAALRWGYRRHCCGGGGGIVVPGPGCCRGGGIVIIEAVVVVVALSGCRQLEFHAGVVVRLLWSGEQKRSGTW